MKVYVDKKDKRSSYLKELWLQDGYQISDNISDSDLIYVGSHVDDYLHDVFKKGSHLYSLVDNEKLKNQCDSYHCYHHCISENKEFIKKNTIVSVEALLGFMITKGIMLNKKSFVILGYGNLGKKLKEVLHAFSCDILVVNDNYDIVYPDNSIVVNTVPSHIINCSNKDIIIFDLASKPYGLKEIPEDIPYYRMPALPTYYHCAYSARYLYNSIMKRDDLFVEE